MAEKMAKIASAIAGPATQVGAITTDAQNQTILNLYRAGLRRRRRDRLAARRWTSARTSLSRRRFWAASPATCRLRGRIFGPVLVSCPSTRSMRPSRWPMTTVYGLAAASVWSA